VDLNNIVGQQPLSLAFLEETARAFDFDGVLAFSTDETLAGQPWLLQSSSRHNVINMR
jgi:hypothetical protein